MLSGQSSTGRQCQAEKAISSRASMLPILSAAVTSSSSAVMKEPFVPLISHTLFGSQVRRARRIMEHNMAPFNTVQFTFSLRATHRVSSRLRLLPRRSHTPAAILVREKTCLIYRYICIVSALTGAPRRNGKW